MDNASFHHSERVQELCRNAGVKLIYLLLYSPDYNPIEEFFSELKAFIRRCWKLYLDCSDRSHKAFKKYLEFCVREVGLRNTSARGHFRHAGIEVD